MTGESGGRVGIFSGPVRPVKQTFGEGSNDSGNFGCENSKVSDPEGSVIYDGPGKMTITLPHPIRYFSLDVEGVEEIERPAGVE
jgi:hypothetical protein